MGSSSRGRKESDMTERLSIAHAYFIVLEAMQESPKSFFFSLQEKMAAEGGGSFSK